MLKNTSKIIFAVAAATMAFAPVAAQANTRAGDSGAVYSAPGSQPGMGRSAEGEKFGSAANAFAWVLVALWLSGIVVIAADLDGDDDGRQSPGT